ncbi:GrpB family protein [Actinoplanes sp. NPDC026619]|uniref:GrpB family protein n=1 Tax=Actinoplanes sp. NPDC026619 TaxID=3155798 RepID=UPI00340FDD2C
MAGHPKDIRERQVGTPEQQASGLVGSRPRSWGASVVIVGCDPSWPERYAAVAAPIRAALGERIISLEHVGSTSVPGLPAKPVIDIDLVIEDTADEPAWLPALEALGYRLLLREPWWHGHRMLIAPTDDVHLHVWPADSPEITRHRLFRDWLRSHPSDRDLYATTKQRLAAETAAAPDSYTMAKSDVIDQIFTRIFNEP